MTGGSSASPTDEALQRVLDFLTTGLVRTADAAREIHGGVVLSTPSLSAVWTVNQLRVTGPIGFEALVALAGEELAGFDYRHIVVEDQQSGAALEAEFASAGWRVERELLMTLTGAPDRSTDTSVVGDAGEDEVLEVMARWHAEGWSTGPAELAQLVEYGRREARAHDDRLLGVRSSDGRLVAITKLRRDRGMAQVEDVYTVPEARGRGYARALITRAAQLARGGGSGLIFIEADDNDWPKELYARLGFEPLGRLWQFHRG